MVTGEVHARAVRFGEGGQQSYLKCLATSVPLAFNLSRDFPLCRRGGSEG